MLSPEFANDLVPFTWLVPVQVSLSSLSGSYMSQYAVAPYSEKELLMFRTQWLLSTVRQHRTPLLVQAACYVEGGGK